MKWNDPTQPATILDIENLVVVILNYVVRFAGLAVLVMLVVGGFTYITSGGDTKKTQQAWSYITYAIGGLVLVIASWFILNLISGFTGINSLLEFNINIRP
jgi:hypothetical protein